jgi:hypothetical protein
LQLGVTVPAVPELMSLLGRSNLWLHPVRVGGLGWHSDNWVQARRPGFVSRRPRRCLSTEPDGAPSMSDATDPSTSQPSAVEEEKPKERTKRIYVRRSESRDTSTDPSLPPDLHEQILWTPNSDDPPIPPEHLLSEDILSEAWSNLLICFNPQIQLRSLYSIDSEPIVEPTLALHCPFEGANYRIDAAVQELARRLEAEVLVLDAVQLAAGRWGCFGKGAVL